LFIRFLAYLGVAEPDEVRRLKTLIFVLALIIAPAAIVSAQQAPAVLDMGRLYQYVGYLYDLDPALLAAIAMTESNNNPSAISPKGAQGLMQLMPGTARQYKVDNPFDPVDNVLGAARFLTGLREWSRMQAPYGEVDLPAMIAAYNAGPGAVEKYGGLPPYLETQAYVRKVLWLYLLGEPTPRRLNPMRASGRAVPPASAAPQAASPRLPDYKPVLRGAKSRSVFDQLAEIKRNRAKAESRETIERAELHIN
jgi:Transglycosylase SLT domain